MDGETQRPSNHRLLILKNDVWDHDIPAILKTYSADGTSVLLELRPAVEHNGIIYAHAVAKFRAAQMSYVKLLADRQTGCAITFVPADKYNAADPFNLSWWRGGAATITDIRFQ